MTLSAQSAQCSVSKESKGRSDGESWPAQWILRRDLPLRSLLPMWLSTEADLRLRETIASFSSALALPEPHPAAKHKADERHLFRRSGGKEDSRTLQGSKNALRWRKPYANEVVIIPHPLADQCKPPTSGLKILHECEQGSAHRDNSLTLFSEDI